MFPLTICSYRLVRRLVKRGEVPVLSFEISAATRMGRPIRIAHDVRVDIVRREDTSRLKEPMCPEPEVRPPPPLGPRTSASRSPDLM